MPDQKPKQQSELEAHAMNNWKIIGLTATACIVVAAIFAVDRDGAGLLHSVAGAAAAPPAMPAMPVPVARVVKKTIPVFLDYSARTESIQNLTLKAKVSAYLAEQSVPDGADVKKGDLLYKLDPRDFQATLDQVNAQAQRDTASLEYQRANLARGDALTKSGFLDKDSFDQRTSNVHQTEAALLSDQAAIRTAKLNLGYTEIRAPFSGRIGRNQAPVGTLVSAGSSVLNTLVQLDPIYVSFNPSETDLVQIQEARAKRKVAAEINMPGESTAYHKGELSFIDNVVDQGTGTITARSTIANPDFTLLPGQYVRVRLLLREQPDALMVPQTAIGSSQLGKYVYIVDGDGKAEQHFVTLGASDGPLVAITKGVAENDQVINGNLQKIGPGSPVQPLPQPAG
jgi:multidrug efflux system membrane fusion protein